VIPKRILIIGTGSMGIRHFEIAKRLFPSAEIAIYSESDREAVFPRVLSSKSEIKSFQPEISVIANQASRHIEFANYLVKVGSHLLIEKPISSNMEGIAETFELKKVSNSKILVGYNLRYLSSFRSVQSLLKEKRIGRVLDVRIEVGQSLETWRPGRDYRETASARKIDGGGVLRELSHELDYLIELFGFPLWVQANISKVSDLEIDVEDIAHIILGLTDENGADFMVSLHLDFIRRDTKRSVTVIGSEATLEWNLLDGCVSVKSPESPQREISLPGQDSMAETYTKEWEDLIQSINSDTQPFSSLVSSVKTLEVVLAAEESQRSGAKVLLKSLTGRSYD
jgi:predicted dehydrogenase